MSQVDATEANRLYWETDLSVADLAARFDVSRRGLYELLRPFPAGVPCERCGEGLEFGNRLSRRSGQATCPACRQQQLVATEAAADGAAAAAALQAAANAEPAPDSRGDHRSYAGEDERAGDLRQRAVLLGGAAIAGLALGTVATLLARRRD